MLDSFQLVAGHVALDFANTLASRYDPKGALELLPSYNRLIAFARQSGILTVTQARRLTSQTAEAKDQRVLARAIELRETVYFLFQSAIAGDRPARDGLDALNRFLSETAAARCIEWKKGEFRWRKPDFAAASDAPIAPIVEAAATLLTSEDLGHLRECSAPTCRWLFLDHSKNHTRRWCDMKICGNRAKARSFHARQRDATA